MTKTAKQRLQERKQKNNKSIEDALPKSGENVTYPGFVPHGTIMKLYRQCGKKNRSRLAAFAIAQLVRFEGEKFTVTDVEELLENEDIKYLTDKVLGKAPDEDEVEGSIDIDNPEISGGVDSEPGKSV